MMPRESPYSASKISKVCLHVRRPNRLPTRAATAAAEQKKDLSDEENFSACSVNLVS